MVCTEHSGTSSVGAEITADTFLFCEQHQCGTPLHDQVAILPCSHQHSQPGVGDQPWSLEILHPRSTGQPPFQQSEDYVGPRTWNPESGKPRDRVHGHPKLAFWSQNRKKNHTVSHGL